jgi:uncharacterized MAPEG superfamily protein
MHTEIRLLTYSAIVAWLMVMLGSALKAGGNINLGFGNREAMPEPTPMAARADRAAKNMLENLILFTAIILAAQAAGTGGSSRVVLGARLFFFARVAYWPLYVLGVTHVRTAAWAVALAGMGLIVSTIL